MLERQAKCSSLKPQREGEEEVVEVAIEERVRATASEELPQGAAAEVASMELMKKLTKKVVVVEEGVPRRSARLEVAAVAMRV
jgi:hypothetical protein